MNTNGKDVPFKGKKISEFANLLNKENAEWWGTKRWIKTAVIWVLICNFFSFFVLFFWPIISQLAQDDSQLLSINPIEAGLGFFATFATVATGIGITLISQGAILDEKQQGTAEWVLSLPITRRNFLLSKIVAYSFTGLVLMVLIPGFAAYLLFTIKQGSAYHFSAFFVTEGVVILNFFFYLTLTFFLATISNSRGIVIGISMGSILGSQPLLKFFPDLINYTPWGLGQIANSLIAGLPFSQQYFLPLLITVFLSIIFIALAIWKFDQLEF